MSIKKWVPWNWFKKEESEVGTTVPVRRAAGREQFYTNRNPIEHFHREVDNLFERAFRDFGMLPFGSNQLSLPLMSGGVLRPTLDLGATDNEYTITVEIPGVDENDVKLEIVNDTLTIQGEKKYENEDKGKNYYRMERSYGSFQRTLSLPEDVDQNSVSATFKKGVLTIKMSRVAPPKANVRQIEVRAMP